MGRQKGLVRPDNSMVGLEVGENKKRLGCGKFRIDSVLLKEFMNKLI